MYVFQVRTFRLFTKQLHRIHVARLEQDSAALQQTIDDANERLRVAEEENRLMRLKVKQLEATCSTTAVELRQKSKRINELEHDLEVAQVELVGVREQVSAGLLERAIRFFTCSAAVPVPVSPRRTPPKRKNSQVADTHQRERAMSASATIMDAEDEEIRSKDADVLWSVSRYVF